MKIESSLEINLGLWKNIYNPEKRINYKETYALVDHLESIRLLSAFACSFDFKLYQMDVKSAFLTVCLTRKFVCLNHPILRIMRTPIMFLN